jgi:Co/Zn/Cd efflux system component
MAMRKLKDSIIIKNPVHWDPQELEAALKAIPGNMWELLLELLEGPKTFNELIRSNTRVIARFEYFSEYKPEKAHRMYLKKLHLNEKLQQDLALLVGFEILNRDDNIYSLTLKGREIAEHGQQLVPKFLNKLLSAKFVSGLTLIFHIVMTVVKLLLGFLFGSAGLIADGTDNGIDTGSSLLIWFGVKYKRERLISLIIIILMYASLGLIGYESVQKFINPDPIDRWGLNLILTLICGGLMWLLSGYQYLTGQYSKNFSIVCQSVDSQNHFYTSLLVSAGIIFSVIAQRTGLWWLNYGDAIASVIVGILILKGAIELSIEYRKEQEEKTSGISHYVKRSMERLKQRIIFGWLHRELEQHPLEKTQIQDEFLQEFGKKSTSIESMFPLGFQPETLEELEYYLQFFQKKHMITQLNGKYYLSSIIGVKVEEETGSIKSCLFKLRFQQIIPKILLPISTFLILAMIAYFIYGIITGLNQTIAIYCGSMFVVELIFSNLSRFLRRRAYYTKRKVVYFLLAKQQMHSLEEIFKKTWIRERELNEIIQIFINNGIINGKLEQRRFIPAK